MKFLRFIFIFSCLFLVSCSEKQAAESAIENMLDEIQAAVEAQNAQQLLSHFSANARIQFTASPELGGDMDLGVKEYGLLLELSWSLPAEYDYTVKDVEIIVADGLNHAVVTDKTYEKVSMQGKVVLSTMTEQTMDVVFLDGKPLINKLQGTILLLHP